MVLQIKTWKLRLNLKVVKLKNENLCVIASTTTTMTTKLAINDLEGKFKKLKLLAGYTNLFGYTSKPTTRYELL